MNTTKSSKLTGCKQIDGVPHIPTEEFNALFNALTNSFNKMGFKQSYVQNHLDILAACEDPGTVSTFEYCGFVYPLPQTNQMRLEDVLMDENPNQPIYTTTTSYRAEPNPSERHDRVFLMFEFESPVKPKAGETVKEGDGFQQLIDTCKTFLTDLGFDPTKFVEKDYEELCDYYGVDELDHEHEARMEKDFGRVVFLKYFPFRTSPFWNMKQRRDDPRLYYKLDVIIGGMETIGSAEREVDINIMKKNFHRISGGQYAALLYSRFGKERVDKELNEYLGDGKRFIPRYGAGVGYTRLLKALKKYDMLDKLIEKSKN